MECEVSLRGMLQLAVTIAVSNMHQNSEENIQVVILDLILGFELAVISMLNCLLKSLHHRSDLRYQSREYC